MPLRPFMISLFTGLLLLGSQTATAAEISVNKSLFGGLAIDGHDAVAYHLDHRAVKGQSQYRYPWHGAIWSFANAENLKRFSAEPARYAPQYGGYCAYAVAAKNERRDVDPAGGGNEYGQVLA